MTETTRIAVAQTALPPGEAAANREALADLAAEAAAQGAALLVAPELVISGYGLGADLPTLAEPSDGPSFQRLSKAARSRGIAVCYGYAERDGDSVYNSAALIGPDGGLLAHHRKSHLFGDYERDIFAVGDAPPPLAEVAGLTVAVMICYEVEFPELVRQSVLGGADLVAVPTATASYSTPSRFSQMVVAARATENNAFVAYANHCGHDGRYQYNGESIVAGPMTDIYALGGTEPALLIADLSLDRCREGEAMTPYRTDRRPELYG